MRCLPLVVALVYVPTALGQTSFPMITHANPVAVQRGESAEVDVLCQQNLFGAYQVLFDGAGLKAEIVPQKDPPVVPPATKPLVKSVKLKVTVDKDAPPGVREFRIATVLGISSIGQLVVVAEPVVKEKNPNNVVLQAQPIALPCVVAGAIEIKEDVDYYKLEAREGDNLAFELFCARLQDKIHDLQNHAKPMLTLFDDTGRELAANDTFYFADPLLTYTAPKTGVYYLQVRESTYDGDPRWVYALLATNRPYISHVYPMAGNAGKTIDVEPIGSAGLPKKTPLLVPDRLGIRQVQLKIGASETNPATFIVNKLPPLLEQEPNDDPEMATRFTLPAGLNGKIDKRRDMDHFVFAGKKGQAVLFELKARRFGTLLNSSLHGVLEVMDKKGAILALSDVSHGQEAKLTFTPTADGDFILRVRDLNSKGGPSFVYHVEADLARPDFSLRCDPDKAMIGPGSSTAWYVHVVRENGFTGPVEVAIKNLPKDVVATQLTIPPTMTQGLIVVTAQPSAAPLSVANVEVVGTGTVKGADGRDITLTRSAVSNQEIYFPGGGRGKFDVNLQTVGITEPSDILRVGVGVTEIVLKPGQEVKIDVDILRRADYDKSISLDVILQHLGSKIGDPLPPGVTIQAGKSKTLLGTASKGHIVLKADAGAAPIERVPISVLCHVSINFVVKVSYSSPVIWLSVRK